MDQQVERLVNKTWGIQHDTCNQTRHADSHTEKYQDTPASQRLMVAVSGIPGSGMHMHYKRLPRCYKLTNPRQNHTGNHRISQTQRETCTAITRDRQQQPGVSLHTDGWLPFVTCPARCHARSKHRPCSPRCSLYIRRRVLLQARSKAPGTHTPRDSDAVRPKLRPCHQRPC